MTEEPVEYELRAMFDETDDPDHYIKHITPEFGHWFAGFMDGEGHLSALAKEQISRRPDGKEYTYRRLRVALSINLRADDIDILRYIMNTIGCGGITETQEGKGHISPLRQYVVSSSRDLACIIVPLLTKYPMRAKKAREFPLWSKAVGISYQNSIKMSGPRPHGTKMVSDATWREFGEIEAALKAMRKYHG